MDKKISELDQALQINNDAVFPMSQDNSGTDTTYKTTITQLSTEIGEGQTFSNLQTTDKTLVGAINEVAQGGGGGGSSNANLAPDYDATSTYAVGDWCIYNGTLYQCNTAIPTAEAFDPTHWTAKKVVDAFADIEDELDGKVDTSDFTADLLPIQSGSATNTKDYIDTKVSGVVESGSNANGNYVKYADGTLICYKTVNVSGTFTNWGNVFLTQEMSLGSFAFTFYATPILQVSPVNTETAASIVSIINVSTTSCGVLRAMRGTSLTGSQDFTFSVMAIGRWKA